MFAAPAGAADAPPRRVGVSAASDGYAGEITVGSPDEYFQVHVLVVGPADGLPLTGGLTRLNWGILQACCDGTIEVVDVTYDDCCHHDGYPLVGVESVAEQCLEQPVVHLATLTMRMFTQVAGNYQLLAGPLNYAYDCAAQPVNMDNLNVVIHYAGGTPVERASLGSVKAGFR
jgi:hypothetical protein